MDRVFLDANVLFSAAYAATSRLRSLWLLDRTTLLTSRYAASEAVLNLSEVRPARVADLMSHLGNLMVVHDPTPPRLPAGVALADKDAPILAAAIGADATHLLTGDNHFAHLMGRVIGGVLVMRPGDYLRARGQ